MFESAGTTRTPKKTKEIKNEGERDSLEKRKPSLLNQFRPKTPPRNSETGGSPEAVGSATDATSRTGRTSSESCRGAGLAAKEREDFRSLRRNVRWCVFFFFRPMASFSPRRFDPRAPFRCSPLRAQRPHLSVCSGRGQEASEREREFAWGGASKTPRDAFFHFLFPASLGGEKPKEKKGKGKKGGGGGPSVSAGVCPSARQRPGWASPRSPSHGDASSIAILIALQDLGGPRRRRRRQFGREWPRLSPSRFFSTQFLLPFESRSSPSVVAGVGELVTPEGSKYLFRFYSLL